MGQKTVIFDVDDTLVQTGGIEDALFPQAVQAVLGPVSFRSDWSDYTDVTDAGILKGVAADNHIEEMDTPAIKSTFFALLQARFRQTPCLAIDGAVEMLRRLQSRQDVAFGFATGGWAETATLKLESAGLACSGLPMTSSNDAVSRTAIMQLCAEQLSAVQGRIVYVGDGEWDKAACAQLGWHFIGIGPRLEKRTQHWIRDYQYDRFEALIDHVFEG